MILKICQHPGRFRHFDPPAHRHFSNVFPDSVIYQDEPDRIWIGAAMHLKRRPGYWQERVG